MATPLTHDPVPSLPTHQLSRRVDMHCHCLPGVDDGPAHLDEAIGLCRALVADGLTDVIATPHQLGRYEACNAPGQIRQSVQQLESELDRRHIPLRVHAGAEVRVDERIPRLLERDELLTLGDAGRYLLLELSTTAYIQPAGLLSYLSHTKLGVILAHAERYPVLQRDPDAAGEWIDRAAMLQINADSLIGAAGTAAASAAWNWLARGWVSLVATDAHNTSSRRPRMTEAMNLIAQRLGNDVSHRVCLENPLCILEPRPLLGLT